MRKTLTFIVALVAGAAMLSAQEPYDFTGRWNVSVQGGPMLSINENHFAYKEADALRDLFTWQGSAAVGYDILPELGVRLSVGFGENAGCGNKRQSNNMFFPYTFKSVNAFVDAILNVHGISEDYSAFTPKFYAGLGYGHTFDFQRSPKNQNDVSDAIHPHPGKCPVENNNAFGFRFGFIGEYTFTNGIGIYVDICGEGYTDGYNGIKPTDEDQASTTGGGAAGFPLDCRGLVSLGLIYHFK